MIEVCLVVTNKCNKSPDQTQQKEECLNDLANFMNCLSETDEEIIHDKSWNFAIQHLLNNPKFEKQGMLWYERIVKNRKLVIPNNFTLNAVLKYCSKIGETALCEEIIDILIERGQCTVYSFIFLLSSMIQNGKLNDTINAILKMQQVGIEPNFGVVIPLLKEATRSNNTIVGMKLYDIIKNSGLESMSLSTTLITFFSKCGKHSLAIKECQRLQQKGIMDVISWTCLIQSLIEMGNIQAAIESLREMLETGVKPDCGIFIVLFKTCTKNGLLEEGKLLHLKAIELLNNFNIDLHNTIVSFYANCGEPELAIEEFQKLQMRGKPDVISWTCLIQAFIASKKLDQAIDVISLMKNDNTQPNYRTFIVLITACANHSDYRKGESIITNMDLSELNEEIVNSIINFYTKCGYPDRAIEEFRKYQRYDLIDNISWNCLIQAYLSKKDYNAAIAVLHEMENCNKTPNATTYSLLLSALGENRMYEDGVELLQRIPATIDSVLSNTIITFYIKCGYPEKAVLEFQKMQSKGIVDITSWNCLIQAYIGCGKISQAINTIAIMKEKHQTPNDITFIILLTACSSGGLFHEGKVLHSLALQLLKFFNTELHNTIIRFYTKCGNPEIAIEEFYKLKMTGRADIISWNCLIQAYVCCGDVSQAVDTIAVMRENNHPPNDITFIILLKGCLEYNLVKEGLEIYQQILTCIKNPNVELVATMMTFLTNFGYYETAVCEFKKHVSKADISLWNCLIQAYVCCGNISEAIHTLTIMREKKQIPNDVTFTLLLKGCADNTLYREGIEIYRQLLTIITNPSIELATSIMTFYTKCGHPISAINYYYEYNRERLMNVGTATALIQAHAEMDDMDAAFQVFKNMLKRNIKPNIVTCVVLLQACAKFSSPAKGRQVLEYIHEFGLDKDEILTSSIALYHSKLGEIELSKQILEKMLEDQKKLSIETCNNILSVYAHHGKGVEAYTFYSKLIKEYGLYPIEKTYTILLNALSYCGMVEQAESVYNSIENPSIHNKCAMVDALARKGRFQEAENLILDSNSYILWNTLMSSCRKFNNLQLGEKVYKILISIDELEPSAYLLLSHIYMYYNMTEKANNIRELMISKNIKVTPGIVYYEENGVTYKFISGDNDFDRVDLVEQMRNEIFNKIIKIGYKPDTSWVTSTYYRTEDEKIKALFKHAEKTAIAHAFVLDRNRTQILLSTNLRVYLFQKQ